MQKIIYLVSRIDDIFNFRFTGYHYGPYSKGLQKTLGRMSAFGLIREEEEEFDYSIRYSYALTNEGVKKAEELWKELDEEMKRRIDKLAKKGSELNSQRLEELLDKAYKKAEQEGIL